MERSRPLQARTPVTVGARPRRSVPSTSLCVESRDPRRGSIRGVSQTRRSWRPSRSAAAGRRPRRAAQWWRTLLRVVAVAVMVAGCAGGTTAINEHVEPTDAAGDVSSLDALALPLESMLMLGEDTKAVLDSAVDTLTDQCMSQLGFDYIPYPPAPPRSILSVGTRYGYLSAADASATGYATSSGCPSPTPARRSPR